MDGFIIAAKFIITIYCVIEYTTGKMEDGPLVILLILLTVSANMLCYIVRRVWLKKAFLALSLMLIVLSAYLTTILFLFLLPLICAEICTAFNLRAIFAAVPSLLAALAVEGDMFQEYLLTAAVSLLIYYVLSDAYGRIERLTQENGNLREKNDSLYKRYLMEQDYENQIRYLSQLEERNSLSQKIHDKLGHAIAGSLIQLEAASMLMGREQPDMGEPSHEDVEKARQMVGKVISLLKEGMEDIRSTLRSIKPAPEQLGINRLKTMLDEFSMSCPIKSELEYDGNISVITHQQWRVITDNVKEALTNAMKYSKARNIRVGINVMNKLVKVEVKDDGVGSYSIKKGLGIKGMEERTESLEGKLVLDDLSYCRKALFFITINHGIQSLAYLQICKKEVLRWAL